MLLPQSLRRCLACLSVACLIGCAEAWAASPPPRELRVVSDINYPPYLFRTESGDLQGILKEKWALWSQRTGIPVRVEGLEWVLAQESVRQGTADVVEALSYTPRRALFYEYSPAYAPVEARVYFHRSISGINDVDSMRGFSIGAKEGSACAGWLLEAGIDMMRWYPDSEVLVKAAGTGDIRLFCMDSPAAHYFLFKHGLAEEFRESPPLYTTQFHWAVTKGNTELRDFIQAGFDKISARELQDIEARWLGTPLRFQLNQTYLYSLAFIVALLIGSYALLVIWNRTLSSQVSAKTAQLSAALGSLQIHSEKVQDLYNNAPCGYHSLDKDGIFVEINDTELAWLGYKRDEVIGKLKFTQLLTDEGRRNFHRNFEEFKLRGAVRDLEYELTRKDGSSLSVLVSASLIRDARGEYLMSRGTLYDVTERNRARLALRESEERFGQMFRLSPNAIMVSSVSNGKVIDVNEATLRIAGRGREDLVGRTTTEVGFWDDTGQRGDWLEQLHDQEGAVIQFERTIRTPAGQVKHTVVTTTLVELQGERVLLSMVQDVTEKRRAERLLEESERRLSKIISASPQSISITDPDDGTYIEVNAACERQCGYTRAELLGKSAIELGFWQDPGERKRLIADLRRNGVVQAREVQLRHKNGSVRDVLGSAALVEVDGRQLMLFQGVDVTEKRRAERLLEESEARLAKVIEASPEAITIVTLEDGNFVAVNPAAEKLCGYTKEEMVGKSAVQLRMYPNPEEREALIAGLLRNETIHGREMRLRSKDGKLRDVLVSAAPITHQGRKLVLFQAVDITERKAAERALEEHQRMLRELSAHHEAVREGERAHIAREIHDELGQALTALKMELSVLSMKFGEATPQVKESVQVLKERVDSIIQTVRDVSTALRPAALDLGILPGVEWLVGEFRKRSGIDCTVSVTGREIVLPEDRGIVLFRILQESLTNIARHANARKVEILLDHDSEYVRLDVQDDGDGFDVEGARARKTFGLLGMRERAIMLRGDMNISSAPGHGTRVSVSLQIA